MRARNPMSDDSSDDNKLRLTAECAFHLLPDDELETCLKYERFRERANRRRNAILNEAAAVDGSINNEQAAFGQKLELQQELDSLKAFSLPWFSLNDTDKQKHRRDAVRVQSEPVRLGSELRPVEIRFLRWPGSSRERLEIVVNWSKSDKRIAQSFGRLVKKLRAEPGKKAHRTKSKESRGRKSSVAEQLFGLAVWRCRKAKLPPAEIVKILKPLRNRFHSSNDATLLKNLSALELAAEKMLFPF